MTTTFTPLNSETRTHVDTACAAFHLNRKPGTLRKWATYETGPLTPKRVMGRLSWAVEDIAAILNSGA